MKKTVSVFLLLALLLMSVSCENRKDPLLREPTYILNKNSLVYHDPDCKYLPAEKNQVEIEYADIERNPEYRPCGHCNP